MPNGYCGRILHVDLGERALREELPDERFYRKYLGGWGFIAHELLARTPQGIDPLSPENPLVFAAGVVTGAAVPAGGRHAVGAKSPLTGGFGEADVGGFWGREMKAAGYDAIVITGQSASPVYLWVHDGDAEIRDAAELWGKPTADVQRLLREDLGDPKIRVAQCGVAGENLVRYACIMHDVNRAAGRTGLGAVMGSKRLRAIAVRGTGFPEAADPDGLDQARDYILGLRDRWAGFREHGTAGGVLSMNEVGRLPTRNFREGQFEGAEKITGSTITERLLVARDTCYACPIACKRVVQSDGAYTVDPAYGGPEYETIAALGSSCGVDHLEAVAYGNQLCNAYGLDTISTGVTIAWAMECFERGLLTADDTDGLDLSFGNHEAMTQLVEGIARRQGFGDLLAEGTLRAARAIGRGTERYAVHTKGQEYPMHDPRFQFGLGIGYATSPTGADHMHNFHDAPLESEARAAQLQALGFLVDPMPRDTLPREKAAIAATIIRFQVLMNCIGLCMFPPYRPHHVRDILAAVSGWDVTAIELLRVGERALALARVYNAREGFAAADDTHPPRFAEPLPRPDGQGVGLPAKEMAEAIDLYYELQGWDPVTGAPTPAKLTELGIPWAAESLDG